MFDAQRIDLSNALSLLFPRTCLVCGRTILKEYLCHSCTPVKVESETFCQRCFSPIDDGGKCNHCQVAKIRWNRMRYLWPYNACTQALLRTMKYQPSARLTQWAGLQLKLASPQMWPHFRSRPWELLLHIPSAPRSLIRREFCVTALLAKQLIPLAKEWIPEALTIRRATAPQARLSAERRINNVRGAFRADRSIVDGASILLIDDVVTTGATINEACSALLTAGAKQVDVYSLARSERWGG